MTEPASAIVTRFNAALNAGDVEAMLSLMTPDCVFENTSPAPDGERIEGQAAQRIFWRAFFQGSAQARIEIDELIELGEHCVARWTYHWIDRAGAAGHIRGVDVFQVRHGLITRKLSYVKG